MWQIALCASSLGLASSLFVHAQMTLRGIKTCCWPFFSSSSFATERISERRRRAAQMDGYFTVPREKIWIHSAHGNEREQRYQIIHNTEQ